MGTAEDFGHTTGDLIINRNSIHQSSQRFRPLLIINECLTLQLQIVTVQKQGKLLSAITRNKKFDRLPLIISANGQELLLGVPQLSLFCGTDMAGAIYKLIADNKNFNTVQTLYLSSVL